MNISKHDQKELADQGYLMLRNRIEDETVSSLRQAVTAFSGNQRHIDTKVNCISEFVHSEKVHRIARELLQGDAAFVRAILFNKAPENNWGVSWHQDKTIAVSHQQDIEGWGPWTVKDGVTHVQPDVRVLENMIILRLHLDDATNENGCLKVIPKSHHFGVLTPGNIIENSRERSCEICTAQAGDILAMKPLLIHASDKSTSSKPRRILHLEYTSYDLPRGLAYSY